MRMKLGDGASPTEAFTEIGLLDVRRFLFRQTASDATNESTADGWRALLASGTRSMRLEGLGLFRSSSAEIALMTKMLNRTTPNFLLILPEWGTFQGPFHIAEMEFEGRFQGDFSYRLIFESAGALTFTAA